MLLHFLLNYLKTLSVGQAGVWTYGLVAQQTGAYPIELTGRRFPVHQVVLYNDEKGKSEWDCDRQKPIVKELINKLLL